jgi:hypothetical protein
MKRIKLFEKFVGEDKLKKFCEENLAYLIDNGYKFEITDDDQDDEEFIDIKQVTIYKSNGRMDTESFKISDIKYDLIPFLIELDSKWLLRPYSDKESDEKVFIRYTYQFGRKEYISISELDEIDENLRINLIEVLVIGMK